MEEAAEQVVVEEEVEEVEEAEEAEEAVAVEVACARGVQEWVPEPE